MPSPEIEESFPEFKESFLNSYHRVMGRDLKPFCLWYQFLLESVGSPLLDPSMQVSIADLEVASLICTLDYKDVWPLVKGRRGRFQGLRRWAKRWAFAFKILRYNFAKELLKFDQYIMDFARPPERIAEPKMVNGRVYHDFPPPLRIATILMMCNFEAGKRKEIWMAELGEAHWYATSFAREKNGGEDKSLVTDHDREFMEGLRAEREAAKAKKEGS